MDTNDIDLDHDGTRAAALRRLAPDVIALASPFGVAAIGGLVTARAIPTWYRNLQKPAWNPPDSVFGPVWSLLYLLMGIALVVARRSDRARPGSLEAVFGLQLALNLAWSLVFFGRRDVRAGLAVITVLWLAIVATIVQLWRARPLAGALLLPYLAWVSFAALLNAEVARLNPATS